LPHKIQKNGSFVSDLQTTLIETRRNITPRPSLKIQYIKLEEQKHTTIDTHVMVSGSESSAEGQRASKRRKHVQEPMLDPNQQRDVIYPIKHPDIWKRYKKHQSLLWTCEEINFEQDRSDFNNLTPAEQHVLKSVLSFFAVADGIVMENLGANFCSEVKLPEAQYFYKIQDMIESVHAECYALLVETLISDPQEKRRLFDGLRSMPHVQQKAQYARNYMDPTLHTFAERLVAFAAVEGILFCASFATIYAFKERNVLKGLTLSNEFIARDERMHHKFAALLFTKLVQKPSPERILTILTDAVKAEQEFVRNTFTNPIRGIDADIMCRYVEKVADEILVDLGQPSHYKTALPSALAFMDALHLERKANFFEVRASEYQRPSCANTFDLNAAF